MSKVLGRSLTNWKKCLWKVLWPSWKSPSRKINLFRTVIPNISQQRLEDPQLSLLNMINLWIFWKIWRKKLRPWIKLYSLIINSTTSKFKYRYFYVKKYTEKLAYLDNIIQDLSTQLYHAQKNEETYFYELENLRNDKYADNLLIKYKIMLKIGIWLEKYESYNRRMEELNSEDTIKKVVLDSNQNGANTFIRKCLRKLLTVLMPDPYP